MGLKPFLLKPWQTAQKRRQLGTSLDPTLFSMRVAVAYLLCIVCADATKASWPWPWSHATTTPAPSAISAFETGVANALGFQDIAACYEDPKVGIVDLWDAAEDYRRGGFVSKAKALALFGTGLHHIIQALDPCTKSQVDAGRFMKLIDYLRDPRYYTVHNALTLALNLAEDRKQLEDFAAAWQKGDFQTAGSDLVNAAFDVLLNPGIPSNNGTEATQIAQGIAAGFVSDFDFKCFAEVSVEIPALIGGVIDLATGVKSPSGLESLFYGLTGLVPMIKACLADKPEIMTLLHEVEDFRHPAELAKQVLKNIESNGIDISLQTASAVLAYKGQEYQRFGLSVGEILGKIFRPAGKRETVVV